jgi:diaminopimelate decarboxylase
MLLPDTAAWSPEGHLYLGGCDTVDLAHRYGTPLYVYDRATLRNAARAYKRALASHYPAPSTVAYASKAYLCVELARLWAAEGLGLDVVGSGELEAALRAGFPAERIHLHGNNKPSALLQRAIAANVGRIVVDGWYDLERLAHMSLAKPVRIWLRLSPGIDAHTHDYRKTGLLHGKFGFPIATGDAAKAVEHALCRPDLELRGLHAHVGSQIFDHAPFAAAARALIEFASLMYKRHGWALAELSPGGGLGVAYTTDQPGQTPEDYVNALCQNIVSSCQASGLSLPHLVLEPGRSLVARAGVALYTVGRCKRISGGPTFVALDGGLADNPRPALYGARYTAFCASKREEPVQEVTLCGPFCESGDVLVRDVCLPALRPGDIVAIPVSGAYQLSMASVYNGFPRPAAAMVAEGRAWLMQRRETVDDLLCRDVVDPGS